jgi:hypothetical protein
MRHSPERVEKNGNAIARTGLLMKQSSKHVFPRGLYFSFILVAEAKLRPTGEP